MTKLASHNFTLPLLFAVLTVGASPPRPGQPARWSWQNPQAKVDPKGDLTWQPQPFTFEPGDSVRYIDFASGHDTHPGTSPERPWKHHPWDPQAGGEAARGSGLHTYVFKRGVVYRGSLTVREAGRPGQPIRLTSDPDWGSGEAVLCGSEQVTGWRQGTDHKDIPQPSQIWWTDLDFAPRTLWIVADNNQITRIPVARTPNWKVSNPDDVKSEWWVWDNPRKPFGNTIQSAGGQTIHLGIDTRHIKDQPEDYFKGALIWPEFGWVMSAPYPTEVEVVDLAQHGLGFAGWTGGGTGGVIMRNMRYYLEDKPHYLDDPEGEFWFDKKGTGGRLYLRSPAGLDPNAARIEAGRHLNLIDGERVEHLHISGLTFRFTTPYWTLTAAPWNFNTKPWTLRPEIHPGCIRVWGEGRDIRIDHCLFEHVVMPIQIRSLVAGQRIEDVHIEDNEFRYTDEGILVVSDGSGWGYARLRGRLGDVRVVRNRSLETGRRPSRYATGTGMAVTGARTLEMAGNIIERSYAQGIDVHGSKSHGVWGEVPFTRQLIHHNKVWESMLNCNDYGGIETWQGGPFFVFNNISHNALGYRHWERYSGTDAGFGHAYYLDGAFKNYHFNNIAWGRAKDVASPVVNCSAFQEIHSYQNTFFHNTVYNYHTGSRRQEPVAGRNKYLANIWDGIGKHVFRHADPARTEADGLARHKSASLPSFDLPSNAYGRNIFHDIAEVGVLEPSGRWLRSFDDFQSALVENKSLLAQLGQLTHTNPIQDPVHGDFRPTPDSAALDQGVRVFVPWPLSGVVGEWNFYHSGDDPARILDEHWYMTDYHVSRETYYQRPMHSLHGVRIEASDYIQGPLEDWIAGALQFDAAKQAYATLKHSDMMKPFTFEDLRLSRHEGGSPETFTIQGEALRNPQIHTSNLLIELYFKSTPGHVGGVLVEKMSEHGYSLTVAPDGRLRFVVKGPGEAASLTSQSQIHDGAWHHAIVEVDRARERLVIYLDGRTDATGAGINETVSLANEGDLFVGGTPKGRSFGGVLEFLRMAQGTLADAATTIEELHAWEFDGPFLRDFAGRSPLGQSRDAGALERIVAPASPGSPTF